MARKNPATAKSPAARTKRARQAEADSPVKERGKRADSSSTKSAHQREPKSVAVEERAGEQRTGNTSFPVVGIGASAGGLEAFRQLLEHLPVDTGMAFVLVQHLDPTHESILTELLSRSTRIPVSEVRDGMAVKPDHVYVIPRNTNMAIREGVLRLLPREEARGLHRPIDYFLRSLSEDQSHRAIGVILSGTASDGTLGLEAIKAEGGITFAQDANSAKYDSMPRSAAAAGHVDFILTPEGIAQELARISRHPYVTPPAAAVTPIEEEAQPTGRNGFRKILALLRKSTGVDFTDYKANTLNRRITRRMVLNKLESTEDYARYLREDAEEVEALYQDILINVTSFFRNPETFVVLKEKILPKVVQQRTPDEPVRVWVLGCSTGQEAYSIAMSFVEFGADHADHIPVQIFATDLSDKGIEKARSGFYSKDITEDVSSERLRRFFTEADGGYRISKPLRDMVVFARQNVIADPPFSRLDLISCRNLLIYLEPILQKRVLPALHYALKPTGILWLGTSETPGSASDLFAPEEKKHRFYSKKLTAARMHFQPARGDAAHERAGAGQKTNYVSEQIRGGHDPEKEADRILLARYSPASVLINAEMDILQFRGSTAVYLESPSGKATLNLLKMAREGLMLPLRAAIQKAKKADATIRKEGVRVNYDGEFRQVNLEVIPIKSLVANERSFLVLFEPDAQAPTLKPSAPETRKAKGTTKRETEDRQVERLQRELATTREYMQSLLEQHEAASEELQSSSEEIQSSNEELQSINEEMETAKEELESGNEELATLNDELQNRNLELTILNDDQSNLFDSVSIPIVMLDSDMRIRRFTPQAEKVLSLISTDVGRPISDIKLKINCPDLEELIAEVIDTVSVKEREVQDKQGHWYSMRVRPYKTLDNKIDGAVIVLVDIDALKRNEAEIRESRDYSEAIVRTTPNPLLILNADLRVHTANEAFYSKFKVSRVEAEGRLIYDMGNHQWNIPRLRELLEEILPRNSFFNDFEVTHDFEPIGQRTLLLNARRLDDTDGQPARILLGIQDITELLHFQVAVRRSEIRYRRLFEAARDGVLLMDPATRRILDANPFVTELLDYTREELLGKELFEIGVLKDEEASRAAFHELQEKGFVRYEDLPLETKSGKRREVEMVSNLYKEDGEKIIQCNIRDITERKQAEQALRESQTRYQALVQASAQIVTTTDASGAVVEDSPSWRAFTGQTYEQWKDFGWLDALHPDDRERVSELWRRAVAEHTPLEIEYRIRNTSGAWRWTAARAVPVLNPDGSTREWIGMNSDISERKQAEDALRESEERYRTLFASAPMAVFACDRNAVIQHYNRHATELWGREPERGVEQHCGSVKLWLPDDTLLPHDQSPMVEVLRTGIPARNVEVFIERPDGSRLPVLVNFAALKNAQGEITGAITSFIDITKRKQAEEALREAGERFRFMAESMPQKIFTARPNGEMDYFNQQWTEFTGLSFDQIKDWGWTQFIHPGDVEGNVRNWQHSIDTGEPFELEHRFRRAGGEYRWHLTRALAMHDADGKVSMWIGSNTDIDDVKRVEEERERLLRSEQEARQQAETANRIKDDFLATVSHELRTPLTAIMGWADLLHRGELNEQTAARAAESIARNARAQNQLISDLLDVSRIISGKLRFEISAVDLIQVIESATDTVRPAADAKGVDLRLMLDPKAGLVPGDANRLEQVVWNLLSNAIKYTPRGGVVETRLEREGTNVAIIVRDTGEGISADFLPYVFARFRQADGTTTRQHGGLGLGLAIVRSLVEAHGGSVHADSAGTGQGATFTVTLPLIAVRSEGRETKLADAGEAVRGQSPLPRGLNAVRVLVVDDELDAREVLSLALTQEGAEVRVGATVAEALEILDQWIPDVLVSDIGMPSEDGYTLIKEVRAREAERGGLIQALALTGYASDQDASRARAAGFQMHLPKPVESARFIAAVASLAKLRGASPQTLIGEIS